MLIWLLSVWTKSYDMAIQMKLFSSTLVLSYIWFRLQKKIRSETFVNSCGTTTNRGMLAVFIYILITATPSPHHPPPHPPIPRAHCFLPHYNPTNQTELE